MTAGTVNGAARWAPTEEGRRALMQPVADVLASPKMPPAVALAAASVALRDACGRLAHLKARLASIGRAPKDDIFALLAFHERRVALLDAIERTRDERARRLVRWCEAYDTATNGEEEG